MKESWLVNGNGIELIWREMSRPSLVHVETLCSATRLEELMQCRSVALRSHRRLEKNKKANVERNSNRKSYLSVRGNYLLKSWDTFSSFVLSLLFKPFKRTKMEESLPCCTLERTRFKQYLGTEREITLMALDAIFFKRTDILLIFHHHSSFSREFHPSATLSIKNTSRNVKTYQRYMVNIILLQEEDISQEG